MASNGLAHGAIIQHEWKNAQHGAERGGGKAAMISHWEIGCGDFQTIKYANARSNPLPSRNGHLGTFQSLTSFTCFQFREKPAFSASNASLSPRLTTGLPESFIACATCVIFNPAARGNKARHFRRHLDEIASRGALKATAAPGDARRLAMEAVADGFELIVAAGGDGT